MKGRLPLVLLFTAWIVFVLLGTSQIVAARASLSREQMLLLLWSVWTLLFLGLWGWRFYVLLYYRRAKAEFVRWVRLRPRSKRLYPEYAFEAGAERYPLVNRHHMKNDEPWPMTVLHHPVKPKKASFFTLKEFVIPPLLEMLNFACITYILLNRLGGWGGLWAQLTELL